MWYVTTMLFIKQQAAADTDRWHALHLYLSTRPTTNTACVTSCQQATVRKNWHQPTPTDGHSGLNIGQRRVCRPIFTLFTANQQRHS
jgi:hypothetical protein